MQTNRPFQILPLLAVLCAVSSLPLFAQNGAKPAPETKVNPFSPFSLHNEGGTAEANFSKITGGIEVELRGPNLNITTARYDMAAPRITLNMLKGKANHGEATGGVKVEVRETEIKRVTNLTGSLAVYSGAKAARPAQIEVTGNVRVVVHSPDFSGPWITTCKKATVAFLDANTTHFNFEGMISAGTLNEPAPKPKKP